MFISYIKKLSFINLAAILVAAPFLVSAETLKEFQVSLPSHSTLKVLYDFNDEGLDNVSQRGHQNTDIKSRSKNITQVDNEELMPGKAIAFSLPDSSLVVNNIFSDIEHTVSFWLKLDALPEKGQLQSIFEGSNWSARRLPVMLLTDEGQLQMWSKPRFQKIKEARLLFETDQKGLIETGKWTHFTYSSDRDKSSLYINGKKIIEGESALTAFQRLRFGVVDDPKEQVNSFKGALDNLTVFRGRLDQAHIDRIYSSGFKQQESPLSAALPNPSNTLENVQLTQKTLTWTVDSLFMGTQNPKFRLQLSKSRDLSSPLVNELIDNNAETETFEYSLPDNIKLEPETTYYWRVDYDGAPFINETWQFKTEALKTDKLDTVSVMAWNIFEGGQLVDPVHGHRFMAEIILQNNVDIITLQEPKNIDNVKRVADKLGFYYSFGEGNEYTTAIISRYPITQFYDAKDRNTAYQVQLNDEKALDIYSVHLKPSPDVAFNLANKEFSDQDLIMQDQDDEKWNKKGRVGEVELLLSVIDERAKTINHPIILAGDFNTLSARDFTEQNKDHYQGRSNINWPSISLLESQGGFVDSYRVLNPSADGELGLTFSPFFISSSPPVRIDYTFHKGNEITPVESFTNEKTHPVLWTSDHAGVVTRYKITP
ncbi:endonuclease/exonuclease/phosphatase family protein [Vibrio sp. SS-MA-C1-2]|uniref:endonuclease/exonuclease/phosphatase family protein n=1 Tax=Vibrio sp. SS-MA-C1-2 TaxID=2908646 RepID=UPI001F295321|nr:endonuclease/exonuclease/phosphatase family protein [Vibrio sp. SS-MA-C1-2]UJF18879.1 endonuclease/exonuclease/phosphatase family protein [Vibrio sp. SS-MA-C1-2]